MLNKLFGRKPSEPSPEPNLEQDQVWPTLPTRPRFRRTRSAASESLYADYVSDDWGDAATVLYDRDGHAIDPSVSDNSVEEWQQRPGLFRNVSARVRSLSVSRPNWSRAPPTYGWAERVEQAGGPDDKQQRRDEERSHRPVTIPVPNPAPGPVDVRGDNDEQPSALQAPALVRRGSSSRRSERTALGHRSTTSSPTIIPHSQTPGAGPSRSTSGPGHRRHLSRVEKIAAVFQHVASLPWMADSPVGTYYPPTDDAKRADQQLPAEPFHSYDTPPSVPKRYRPPPQPQPPCWYQPKPPKVAKPKKGAVPRTRTNLAGIVGNASAYSFSLDDPDEFEYPDYDELIHRGYTGDTPELQSDADESDLTYEYPRMIEGHVPFPIRPAYYPAPGKSIRPSEDSAEYSGPLQIMPPPGASAYGYPPEYDDGEETESSQGPIPSPLTTTNVHTHGRQTPLVIPTPTEPARHIPASYGKYYQPAEAEDRGYVQPEAYRYGAPSAQAWAGRVASAQDWAPPTRKPSVQGWGPSPSGRQSAQAQHLPDRKPSAQRPGRKASAQDWPPPTRQPSAEGWGQGPSAEAWGSPQKETASQVWGSPAREHSDEGWGSPAARGERSPLAYGFSAPRGHEPPRNEPSPQVAWGPPPQMGYAQFPYGPPPQVYQAYAPYYPPPVWDPFGVAPKGGKTFHFTYSPPHRDDSPPPIPSPIATSIARSRSSRRRSEA